MRSFSLLVLTSFFGVLSSLHAQSVRDVEMTQEGKNIIIEYVLEANTPQEIRLTVSTDGGRSFSAPLRKVTGDVGRGIRSGKKRIEWRVLEEVDELVSERVVFMVEIVEDVPVVKYSKPKKNFDLDDFQPEGGQVRIGALLEVIQQENYQAPGFGFRIEWFWSSALSVDWQFLFGENHAGNFYTQVPGASMVFSELMGDPWAVGDQEEDLLSLFLLGLCIPEGITVHMFPHPRLEVAPSLAILRADYNFRNNSRTSLGGALTLRVNYQPFRRFTLSPALGVRLDYSDGEPSLLYGLGMGLRL
ncbi:MAG: hypothetical protein O3C32_07300 [Bacteroidetes bacterium]|jgi:hypothetical protein|nr:hypothetical protein [Bacteroidota bacterium]